MQVGVLPNLDKKGAAAAVEKMGKIFKSIDIKAYLPDNICGTDYIHIPEEEIYDKSDIIITVGGDGTIIRYGKLAAKKNKPVLGVNAGRMGFLADVEPKDLEQLKNLKTGNYSVENRMLLNVTAKDGNTERFSTVAVNDLVFTSGFISRIIDIKAHFGNDCISYRADGLIVATPTGSTAYSLSAGGPIIDPLAENICITPICSHSLSAKPIILNKNAVVRFNAFSLKHSDVYLSVDGRRTPAIKPTTDIFVSRADYGLKLIRLTDRSFYKTLSEKFKEK